MDIRILRENRLHGNPQFPLAAYEQEQRVGDTILDYHWHDEVEFLWVNGGKANFQIGLSTYEVHEGEGIFIPSGEVHGGYSLDQSPCTYRAIVFQMNWLTDASDGSALKYLQPLYRGSSAIPSLYTRDTAWGKLVQEHLSSVYSLFLSDDIAKEMRIKAELYLLFADLISCEQWIRRDPASRVDTQTVDRLKDVIVYMRENYGQPLNVSQLAAHSGMSSGHFSRVFKAFMRKTPMEYVNFYRIQQSAYLLQTTNLSIAETAMEVGLTNFSYFTKQFKAIYGSTPSEFRKNLRSL